jgi:hypothetical protein
LRIFYKTNPTNSLLLMAEKGWSNVAWKEWTKSQTD